MLVISPVSDSRAPIDNLVRGVATVVFIIATVVAVVAAVPLVVSSICFVVCVVHGTPEELIVFLPFIRVTPPWSMPSAHAQNLVRQVCA